MFDFIWFPLLYGFLASISRKHVFIEICTFNVSASLTCVLTSRITKFVMSGGWASTLLVKCMLKVTQSGQELDERLCHMR